MLIWVHLNLSRLIVTMAVGTQPTAALSRLAIPTNGNIWGFSYDLNALF